jgi:hypothetical protein
MLERSVVIHVHHGFKLRQRSTSKRHNQNTESKASARTLGGAESTHFRWFRINTISFTIIKIMDSAYT